MRSIILLAIIFGASIVIGCDKTVPVTATQPGRLKVGECFSDPSTLGTASLCFNSVIEESRCPAKRQCIWAGRAVANFTFKVNNQTHNFELSATHSSQPYKTDTVLQGYKIQFINLYPYPGEQPEAVSAEVKITK